MKRVLSWLCFIVALAMWPQTALALNADNLYLCYSIDGGSWTWNESLTKSGDSFTKTLPAATQKVEWAVLRQQVSGNNDAEKLTNIKADGAWKQYACSTTDFSKNTDYDMYYYGTCDKVNTITGKGTHTLKFKPTGRNDGSSNEIVTFSFTTEESSVVDPTPSDKNFYYGYQDNDGVWQQLKPLTASNGQYSFVIDNTANQVQFFYVTDNNTDMSGVFPKYRYHGSDNSEDTEIGSTDTKLTRQEVSQVLKISNAKNNKITVTFTVNADGSINLKATKVGGTVVEDPYTKTNLPLRPQDFKVGETDVAKPHYFLVGTRMADWRLQPEWELKDLGNNKVGIDLPRVMYTGLISVAKVDNYDDYSYSRYARYGSTDNNGKSFNRYNLSSNLHKRADYAYYRDNTPDYNSVDRFCAADDTNWDDGAIRMNKGIVCDRIEVTLDGNGNPSKIEFILSSDPYNDVTKYLTFSLVGDNIIHEGMADANKTAKGTNKWQDAWVQYNPSTGLPYRDATGRLFYQTVFQSNWLDAHPTFFNKKLGDGRNFNYTSQSITMKNVAAMTEEELADDEYADYYKRFKGDNKERLGKTDSGDQSVKIDGKYDFEEFMRFHNKDASITYGGRDAKWQCFVVKDMWMDGTFKVWTGWGGGLKKSENVQVNDPENARWYYVNGGHGHENCKGACSHKDGNGPASQVRGYDIRVKNGKVGLAATERDVNEADFSLGGLTYFKRVIVWYDPEGDFSNSAIQLIIERLGPAIQATRGTLGSEIDYTWYIPDVNNDFSDEEKAYHVDNYFITRFKLNEDTGEFESMGVIENVSPAGKTVADFLSGITVTDKDLKGGTYRYRIDLKLRDSANREINGFAMSNRVTLFDASQPVKAEAFQVTEGEGDAKKYSFDLELDLDLANFAVSATYQGQGVTDLAKGYLIYIPTTQVDDLNGATAKTVTCHEVTTPIADFVTTEREVTINGETFIRTNGAWVEIPFTKGHIAKKVVWENIIKNVPGAVFDFDVYLIPNDNPAPDSGLPMYKTIFADANFGATSVSTEFFIPGVGVKYEGASIVKYDPTGEGKKLAMDTPEEHMPMASHNGRDINGNLQLHAPVHYTAANNLRAEFSFTEPAVTQKVKDNFTLDYGYSDKVVGRDDLTPVASFEDFENYRFQNYLDVSKLTAPYAGNLHDGKDYYVAAVGPVLNVNAIADVKYRRDGKRALPLEMGKASENVSLPVLPAPTFDIRGELSTTEENGVDEKRYYVHDLYAQIDLTHTDDVKGMVARPGFHLVPDKAHGYILSQSGTKAANGGVVAHQELFNNGTPDKPEYWLPSPYTLLDFYTPFNGEYDEDSDNWAYLSFSQGKLPVMVKYFSVQEKATTPDYTANMPKLAGIIAYHYPFVIAKSEAAASVKATRDGELPAGLSLYSLMTVGNGTMDVDLPVMTAIGSVEADEDFSDAEFFNLQGIRVTDPVPGQIYLVRRGAEVTKVLYK